MTRDITVRDPRKLYALIFLVFITAVSVVGWMDSLSGRDCVECREERR